MPTAMPTAIRQTTTAGPTVHVGFRDSMVQPLLFLLKPVAFAGLQGATRVIQTARPDHSTKDALPSVHVDNANYMYIQPLIKRPKLINLQ